MPAVCRPCVLGYKFALTMNYKLSVKVKPGRKVLQYDSVDAALAAIMRNPFFFIDVRLIDVTSRLFPVSSEPLERLEHPDFE